MIQSDMGTENLRVTQQKFNRKGTSIYIHHISFMSKIQYTMCFKKKNCK